MKIKGTLYISKNSTASHQTLSVGLTPSFPSCSPPGLPLLVGAASCLPSRAKTSATRICQFHSHPGTPCLCSTPSGEPGYILAQTSLP